MSDPRVLVINNRGSFLVLAQSRRMFWATTMSDVECKADVTPAPISCQFLTQIFHRLRGLVAQQYGNRPRIHSLPLSVGPEGLSQDRSVPEPGFVPIAASGSAALQCCSGLWLSELPCIERPRCVLVACYGHAWPIADWALQPPGRMRRGHFVALDVRNRPQVPPSCGQPATHVVTI